MNIFSNGIIYSHLSNGLIVKVMFQNKSPRLLNVLLGTLPIKYVLNYPERSPGAQVIDYTDRHLKGIMRIC